MSRFRCFTVLALAAAAAIPAASAAQRAGPAFSDAPLCVELRTLFDRAVTDARACSDALLAGPGHSRAPTVCESFHAASERLTTLRDADREVFLDATTSSTCMGPGFGTAWYPIWKYDRSVQRHLGLRQDGDPLTPWAHVAEPQYVRGDLRAVEWRPQARSAVLTLPQTLALGPSGTASIEAHFAADVFPQVRARLAAGAEVVVQVDPSSCTADCRLTAREIRLIAPGGSRIIATFPTIRPDAG